MAVVLRSSSYRNDFAIKYAYSLPRVIPAWLDAWPVLSGEDNFDCINIKRTLKNRQMRKIVIMLIFILITCWCHKAHSQDAMFKALFIYNFTKYVEWPETATAHQNFVITILGNPEIFNELNKITKTKKVGLQDIVVKKTNSLQKISGSHILFLSQGKSALLNEVLDLTTGLPIIIVTDNPGMAKKGADINFITIDGKQRFEINEQSMSDRGLKMSAELTNLGIMVN